VSGSGAAVCLPASGSVFPLGTTPVSCSATDAAGNTSHAVLSVTVQDRGAPVVEAMPNLLVEATGPTGSHAAWGTVAAVDDVDPGTLPTTCTPASGSAFALGTTTVTCAAADAAGNHGESRFTVEVVDTTAPNVFVPPSAVAEATSSLGAEVAFGAATATDAVTTEVTAACDRESGSTFGLGVTTVTCRATDAAGNVGSASFGVTVVDTTAPSLSVSDDLLAEATSPAGAAVNYAAATATDLVDGTDAVSCTPTSGSTFPLGTAMVECTAADAAGNASSTAF
jgi:hypothetical protein